MPDPADVSLPADSAAVSVTVIIPAHDRVAELRECLDAVVGTAAGPGCEIIVVDDASGEDLAAAAARPGVRLLRLAENAGPAAARNHGAWHAAGDALFFLDADVVAAPGAVGHVRRLLGARPDVAAVFGSYDAAPRAPGVVTQFRNLLHHFVHQRGRREASTFWAGCGAVRRQAFEAVGGFDAARYRRPSIEDIELGYRLRDAGYRILLDPSLQVTHLKRWTLGSMLATDLTRRALPWARLLLGRRATPPDLNLGATQRASVALVGVAAGALLGALVRPALLGAGVAALAGVAVLNRDLLAFLRAERGGAFAAASLPLLVLHYGVSGLGYALAWLEPRRRARVA